MPTTLEDFLRRGYFPKELPPIFTTDAFAQRTLVHAPPQQEKWAELLQHSHSKFASVRRSLSIPHPWHYYHLASSIVTAWAELENIWNGSNLSRTKPRSDTLRAVAGECEFIDLPLQRAATRSSGRYLFKTDIAAFYPSVYTHSIPWAMHSKTVAKANHAWKGPKRLSGNILDRLSQFSQSGQTVGLPIGPDSSFIIAETILCRVDSVIQSHLGQSLGFRFVDDYEFACSSFPEAERLLAVLQDALSEYELKLSPHKTSIVELPQDLDTEWARALSQGSFSDKPALLQTQLTRFFTDAFRLVRDNPGSPVLKYAVRRILKVDIPTELRPLLHSLLLQCAVTDSGTLRAVLWKLQEHIDGGTAVDVPELQRALNAVVLRHAPLGHGSEVAWAIWAAKAFQAPLSDMSTQAVARMSDDVVALTAMFCDPDAFDSILDRSHWQSLLSSAGLTGAHWLLNYESRLQNWLTPAHPDPSANDPVFGDLARSGTSFIDDTVAIAIPVDSAAGEYPE